MISIWKWFFGKPFPFGNDFFLNDLLPQKMISGCFFAQKKMIYRCEKSFPSSSEMIFYTRKWFRRNSKMIFVKWFLEHFVPVLKMWFTLGEKTISFGNGHFRKWMEIIFFQKMLYNLRKINKNQEFVKSYQNIIWLLESSNIILFDFKALGTTLGTMVNHITQEEVNFRDFPIFCIWIPNANCTLWATQMVPKIVSS